MATNISGSVTLTYGAHTHTESFNTTASTLTDANPSHDYSAGGGRALVGGAALDPGTIDGAEGLLLIKNDNNIGALEVSLENASAYDISIPAGVTNLISVGTSGAVYVKAPSASVSQADVASVSSAGAIVFDGTTVSGSIVPGTAIMTKHTGSFYPDDLVVEIDTATTGTVYELDGVTKKDLTGAGVAGYTASTVVNLVYIVKYRYTLTEA